MTHRLRSSLFSLWLIAAGVLLAGCASPQREADRLTQAGRPDDALTLLLQAQRKDPDDALLRAATLRQRELTVAHLLRQADVALSSQRHDLARALLARLDTIDAEHPRVVGLRQEVARIDRHEQWLTQARDAEKKGLPGEAEVLVKRVLTEYPGHPGARAALIKLREKQRLAPPPQALGPGFQKPVTLEFRDAPLRSVLEGLARTSGVNFVFDKDVRGDAKVSIYLKDVAIDEALRVILSTQQLERKLLNDSTVLVYPATQAKQREHQELVTRNFYLGNADVKQAQALVRTIAKTRDLYVDERLNLLVVRDTPEVVALVEKLLAGFDLPDPEVVLEVEVMEVASNRLDELGINWPQTVNYGIPGASILRGSDRDNLIGFIANPLAVATLRETLSRSNVIANPRLRARNREKAKVAILEKLPVFTTTATPVATGVSTAVAINYLDVGLKLEVEPSVQLDSDVIMKVNLEVSTLTAKVAGPSNSVGYQVGTRQASTSLRLRDGETQILAGLIREEDGKTISGVPGLADLPLVGRLFGLHGDQRTKTEVVLLITPRVVRNLDMPDLDVTTIAAGVDASPGAETVRLGRQSKVVVPMNAAGGGVVGAAPTSTDPAEGTGAPAEAGASAPVNQEALLELSASAQMEVGGAAAVTLRNRSAYPMRGELAYDPALLRPASGGRDNNGRLPFAVAPGGQRVYLLRVQPQAAGQRAEVTVPDATATAPGGTAPPVRVDGNATIDVPR